MASWDSGGSNRVPQLSLTFRDWELPHLQASRMLNRPSQCRDSADGRSLLPTHVSQNRRDLVHPAHTFLIRSVSIVTGEGYFLSAPQSSCPCRPADLSLLRPPKNTSVRHKTFVFLPFRDISGSFCLESWAEQCRSFVSVCPRKLPCRRFSGRNCVSQQGAKNHPCQEIF